jgi:GTP-binding protein
VVVGDPVVALDRGGAKVEEGKVARLLTRRGSGVRQLDRAVAGDIIQLAGLAKPLPTTTIAAPTITRPLYADPIDPPTMAMSFGVNDSPLAGRDGTRLTSGMIADRLLKEAQTNVALQVAPAATVEGMPEAMEVRCRGELQAATLIVTMQREGFELSVSPPVVLFRTNAAGEKEEPYECVLIEVGEEHSGMVIERMAERKAAMTDYAPQGKGGRVRISFRAPSRSLIGFQSQLKTESRGEAQMHRIHDGYGPYMSGLDRKPRAVMVSNASGQVTAYALDGLQARGQLFVSPGHPTYMGHIVGEASRDSSFDMDVNVVRAKKLTNVRASGTDEMIRLTPPKVFSLEEAIVYCGPDELVEVTPAVIRLRKRLLDAGERERRSRAHAKANRA